MFGEKQSYKLNVNIYSTIYTRDPILLRQERQCNRQTACDRHVNIFSYLDSICQIVCEQKQSSFRESWRMQREKKKSNELLSLKLNSRQLCIRLDGIISFEYYRKTEKSIIDQKFFFFLNIFFSWDVWNCLVSDRCIKLSVYDPKRKANGLQKRAFTKCGAEIKSSANIDNNNLAYMWNGLLC